MTKRTRIRQVLKEEVSQLLNAGSSGKPATVFANRPFSVDEQDLPVAFCYMLEGTPSEYALDDAYDSTQLMVSLYVMESNQADAELDLLAEDLAGLNESSLSGLLTEGMGLISWAYGQDEEGTGLASLTLSFNATWSDSDV
ncbi:phage tail terminator protein [Aeromonas caviae]|uniref:Phage tail terminator protein n=1 Tax=Aeromonas caviae TaxID=648 RepID=A0ABU5W9B0_AERCA|nr:phage tail terminator protein [Aeromonas caviae]MEA9437439.1 phage tail terminator protein [Aeromonas caviae]